MTDTSTYRSRVGALRANRDFGKLWIGQGVAELGGSISMLAIPLLAIAMTGNEVMAGLMGTAGFVAMWLAHLPAGYIADMFDRRKIMLWCQGTQSFLYGGFIIALVTGYASVWALMAVYMAACVLAIVFGAAQRQAIRQIVDRDHIPEAISMSTARGYAISMAGPSIGGGLFAVARSAPLIADVVTNLISMLFVSRIKTSLKPESKPTIGRLLPDIGTGWKVLWTNTFLRSKTIYSVTTNVAVSALMFVLIIDNASDSVVLGASLSAAAGAGLVGALIAPFLYRRLGMRTLIVGSALVRGSVLVVAAWSGSPILFAAVLATVMLLGPTVNTALSAATLLAVPKEVLGRASSSSAFVSSALQPFAPLLAGLMLYFLSTAATQLVIAGAFVFVALLAATLPGLDVRPGSQPREAKA
ncbi:MFS transporter [Natronoglycomyces albus]|uniref:MFS transporter n=1 Tax=Natronoglycomyces albus TaxID=2811108 RepID=A0A895XKW5_9ACTN|nr:MFS transporter [Natronoglycomyces albus]QSB04203.1 MFS transporter [Natronoglycomyces albus]